MDNCEVFVRRTELFQFSNDLTSTANVVRANEKLTAFLENGIRNRVVLAKSARVAV
jgi:hypothetical protein